MTSCVLFSHDLAMPRSEAETKLRSFYGDCQPIWSAEFVDVEHQADVEIVVTPDHSLDVSTLICFSKLRMLSLAFTGYDKVDLQYCRELGIHVYYVPGYSTSSVAELVVGLTIAVLRKIPLGHQSTRTGGWDGGGVQPGIELEGKTVGIVGTGTIGLCAARKFRAMGCKVIGWNRTPRPEFEKLGAEYRPSPELVFEEADILSLHLAVNRDTHHFVGERLLNTTRRRPILINVARGQLVDTSALARALADGRLSGAGLDVFEEEPVRGMGNCKEFSLNELLRMDNVVLTPHVGFKTQEALRRLAEEAIANIGRFLRGDPKNCLVP